MTTAAEEPREPLTLTQWLIVSMAAIGFAFDIYELLMMPLIAGPALSELLGVPPSDPQIRQWIGYIFWGSAMVGGAFGLIGGWLTDRLGRRRVLTWSILLYAVSACAAAFSTSATMLLVLRCTTFMGVCIEFVAAIAWLAELFPDPRRREAVLGYTQAFSSLGGLLVTGASALAVAFAQDLPAIYGGHSAWRYTLLSGVFPALPLILIRPFLPESPVWAKKRAQGTLKRPSVWELFHPELRRTTIVTTILFACAYGAAFGALQLTPSQIVPGLPEVATVRKEHDAAKAKAVAATKALKALSLNAPNRGELAQQVKALDAEEKRLGKREKQAPNAVQFYQEMGGLAGRFLLAWLALRIVGRGSLLRMFLIPGLILIPLVYLFPARNNLDLLKWGIAAAGVLTVGQFSFWGNYLPRVFPVHLRGTGESFAANVGGRMIGTSAALVTTQIAAFMPGESNFTKVAYAAATTAFSAYAIGLVTSFWLPEPQRETLPE